MVLEAEVTKQICDFVRAKPRTVQEISQHIKKNWRTAERYVERIEQETGVLATRIFRGGTRGALKVVYWRAVDEIHSLSFQQEIYERLMSMKRKLDFSPFDIYQHVPKAGKRAHVEDISRREIEAISAGEDFVGFLRGAKKQVLIFSGNLSWVKGKQGKIKIMDVLRELLRRGVSIKVVGRVSMVGVDHVKQIMSLNKEIGKDLVEVRHRSQPLRAMIIDDKIVKLREIRDPAFYPPGELDRRIEIFYEIFDKDWVDWLQKVFWNMFSTAMPAVKRIEEIESIEGVKGKFI